MSRNDLLNIHDWISIPVGQIDRQINFSCVHEIVYILNISPSLIDQIARFGSCMQKFVQICFNNYYNYMIRQKRLVCKIKVHNFHPGNLVDLLFFQNNLKQFSPGFKLVIVDETQI